MTAVDYLDAVKERLLADRVVGQFHIVRQRVTLSDGHLRARLALVDGSRLEFSEYVRLAPDDQIQVVTYSYHWTDTNDRLIQRWDNAPHHPELPGFPHHTHVGPADSATACEPMSIFSVLDEIARRRQAEE